MDMTEENRILTDLMQDTDAVIFDLDGTLLDSMWVWVDVDRDFLGKYELIPPADFLEQMEGKSYSEVAVYYTEAFPALSLTAEEIMDEWTQMAREKYRTQVPMKQGARTFLQALRSAGIRTGIATSNSMELVEDALHALDIRDLFDSVHSACEVAAGKPAPDVYLLVAAELNVSPERCLVFEDVPKGIQAGKNAGMRVCAVEDSFSSPQEEKKRELADYYISDYESLLRGAYEVL